MKKSDVVSGVLIFLLIAAAGAYVANTHYHFIDWPRTAEPRASTDAVLYYCPMHPEIQADKPGECPICHMSLVKKAGGVKSEMEHKAERKVLYYRNPMNPQVTSPVPMKDEMGMDYVAVYAEEANEVGGGVHINTQKQQLIGVKTQKVEMRPLRGEIVTVGRVAYDPALFVVQEEYLQAIKSREVMSKNALTGSAEQPDTFVKTARRKLILMGMSEAEVDELTKSGKPQQNLYLRDEDDKSVWVYMNVYEYEAGLVEAGVAVEAEAVAYPGVKFAGKVISVAPVLDAATRSLRVRALVDDPNHKLKLEMFVDVKIKYDLGEKLAVPDEAIMHAGTRDIVYVTDANGYFEPRAVEIGAEAGNYSEVIKGLKAGEDVVTSGNFLVDSETKLNAVLSQSSEPNK